MVELAEPVFVNLFKEPKNRFSLADRSNNPICRTGNRFLDSLNVYKYGLWGLTSKVCEQEVVGNELAKRHSVRCQEFVDIWSRRVLKIYKYLDFISSGEITL